MGVQILALLQLCIAVTSAQIVNRVFLNNGPVLDYTINATHLTATATLPREAGWFGIGFGPGQMPGSTVVIGQQSVGSDAILWDLNGRQANLVVQSANNEVIDGLFVQGDGSVTLSFTLPLQYGAQTLTPDANNNLVWAWGASDTLGFHANNVGGQAIMLSTTAVADVGTPPINRIFLDNDGPVIDYTINSTHLVATATLLQNAGWFGVGFGPGSMPGSTVVIGQRSVGDAAILWDLNARSAAGVVQSAENEVIDGLFTQNNGTVVLSFTLPLEFGAQTLAPDANNILVWAWGESDTLGYHGRLRGGQQIMLSSLPMADMGTPPVNRVFLQDNGPLFEYMINSTHLVATATLPRVAGWLGIGFGPGEMTGSTAVIGQQSVGNTAILWDLNGRSAAAVLQSAENEVIDGSFMVSGGSTILSFTLPLAFGAQTLTPDALNNIVWAWSDSETLNYHGTNRGTEDIMLSTMPVAAVNAPPLVNRDFLENDGPFLQYRINDTHLVAIATLRQNAGWMGIGFSPNGLMVGSTAVIGQRDGNESVSMFDLNGRTPSGVIQSADNTITDGEFISEGGVATLRFTILLNFGSNVIVPDQMNNLVWAWGESDTLANHGPDQRANQPVMLSRALVADVGENPDDPVAEGDPACASSDPNFDFEVALTDDITFNWFVDSMADNLVARATISDTVGWFSIGFGQTPGAMVIANAVVGQISDNSVLSFDLTARSGAGVQPQAVNMVSDMSIEQANGATILSFTVPTSFAPGIAEGEDSNIIWAWGPGDLGFHQNNRGSAALNLVTCNDLANNTFTRNLTALYAHGILMALAWMLFVPSALLSSIFRSKFEGARWLMAHIFFNVFGMILATIGFGLAFLLVAPGNHLSASHHIIGLVVMIFMWLQPLNAAIRPHPPSADESKSAFRLIWEVVHKLFGTLALVAAFYNIWLGLDLTNAIDLLVIEYYIWAGVLALVFLVSIVYYKFIYEDKGSEAKAKWMESQDFNDPSMKLKDAEKL